MTDAAWARRRLGDCFGPGLANSARGRGAGSLDEALDEALDDELLDSLWD